MPDGFLNTAANLPGIFEGFTPDYALKQHQLAAMDAFRDGVPTDTAGNPDFNAMAKTLFAKGALDQGAKLLEAGVTQHQMADAQKLTSGMAKWLTPGGGDAQPAASSPPSFNDRQSFVAAMTPHALAASAKTGIDPRIIIAQSAVETGWGKHAPGNNFFGIKGAGQSLPTTEIVNGQPVKTQASFSAYPDMASSASGYADFINKNPRYAEFKGAKGLGAQIDALGRSGYATDPNYSAKVGAIASIIPQSTLNGGGDASASPAAPAPVRVAQNGDSDGPPPAAIHPFGPTQSSAAKPQAGLPTATAGAPPSPAPDAPQAVAPGATPAVAASPVSRTGPVPTSFLAPPPLSPSAGAVSQPADVSFGGQVPKAWLKAGYSAADFVRFARAQAAIGSANPFAKGAVEQWSKIADGLERSIEKAGELTSAQKDARDPLVQKTQTELATTKATARANAMTDTAARRAELTQEGEALGKVPGQLAADADGARSQNSMLDEMLDASRQFSMGKFADKEQTMNATMSALGHKLGVDTSSIDGKVASYEDFSKLAGQFSRQAMKETGGRAGGIQELRFITNTLPSPTMSQAGFEAVANQLKGLGDFRIAKQQAGASWLEKNGSMRGFDEAWNKNITPSAFVMHRLQVDQPEVFAQTVTRLAQSAQGRATLKSIRSGMSWAGSNGLLD